MTQRLTAPRNAGYTQMNRQAAEIQRIPPVSASTPAMSISNTTEFVEPGAACGECAPPCGTCEPCHSCGSCSGCGCDPLWWDIGGQYRLMFNHANFGWHSPTISDNQPTQTFFNQRFRTWLEVHPNDNVEGYIQMEVGHVGWGTDWDFPKSYPANRWPNPIDRFGDRVGIEMRRGWLQYQNMNIGRLRAGIQGWQDSFGQVLASSDWDFSVGGLSWERTFGDTNMLFGLFALNEGNAQFADDAMLITLDLDRALSEKTSVGASAYYLLDNGGSTPNWGYSYPVPPFAPYLTAWDAWLGLRAKTQVGRIPLNAFFIYNPGQRTNPAAPTFVHEGIAFKLGAGPVPVGPGKCSFQALYSTGHRKQEGNLSHALRTVGVSHRHRPARKYSRRIQPHQEGCMAGSRNSPGEP